MKLLNYFLLHQLPLKYKRIHQIMKLKKNYYEFVLLQVFVAFDNLQKVHPLIYEQIYIRSLDTDNEKYWNKIILEVEAIVSTAGNILYEIIWRFINEKKAEGITGIHTKDNVDGKKKSIVDCIRNIHYVVNSLCYENYKIGLLEPTITPQIRNDQRIKELFSKSIKDINLFSFILFILFKVYIN